MAAKTKLKAPTSGSARWKRRDSSVQSLVTKGDLAAATSRPPLREPAFDMTAFEPDARSKALLRGIRIAQETLRNSGGAYCLEEVRSLMHGISRQAVDKRVQDGSLLAVPGPNNRRSYPTLQFDGDGSAIAGLKAVRKALPTKNPWTVLSFLANPDCRLNGRKPIDVLKEGDVALVVEAARRLGEQGA